MKNLGLLDGSVVEYDVGEFREKPFLSEPAVFAEEIVKSTKEFRRWLQKENPDHLGYFDHKLRITCRS